MAHYATGPEPPKRLGPGRLVLPASTYPRPSETLDRQAPREYQARPTSTPTQSGSTSDSGCLGICSKEDLSPLPYRLKRRKLPPRWSRDLPFCPQNLSPGV